MIVSLPDSAAQFWGSSATLPATWSLSPNIGSEISGSASLRIIRAEGLYIVMANSGDLHRAKRQLSADLPRSHHEYNALEC